MKKISITTGSLAILAMSIRLLAADFPVETTLPGPTGLYRNAMIQLIKTWPGENPAKEPDYDKEPPVVLSQIKTEGKEYYIGIEQKMLINAPLEQVETVVDAIDEYHNMYTTLKDSKILSKEKNEWTVHYEQKIPVFFVPNVKFTMAYITDKTNKDRKAYRYQYSEGQSLLFDDGIVMLERSGGKTKFTKYDFYEPDLGIAKIFSGNKVWKQSFEDMFQADYALKLKAENPGWDYSKVKDTSSKAADKFSVDDALKRQGHCPVKI
jgi:hypothetical protein